MVVVLALAAWGYDRLFANPTVAPTTSGSVTETGVARAGPGAATADAADSPSVAGNATDDATAVAPTGPADGDAIVRLEIVTEPAGAIVTIDGFPLPGRTPLSGVPVSARAGRVVRAELDGYQAAEARFDLVNDGRIEFTLTPEPTADATGAIDVGADRIALTITDATWLEVYRSGARNEGERLVFTTAQPGASYEFALPVYVYVGNAAGARVNLGGQDLGPMGAPGAVLGRAFGP
ncbi:MAG: DUF4115 domain-containing protein [bacterium]|nr:DUF4115 domain-containing protein [bacterium]